MACPRIRKSGNRLGFDPFNTSSIILKEGSIAAKAFAIFVVLIFFKSSPFTETADPVNPSFLRLNIPVTTTSDNSSSITTVNGFISFSNFFIAISLSFIPTKEKNNTTLSIWGTSRENFPSLSVATPTLVPFSKTVTPGKGSFFLSCTKPVILNDSFSTSRTICSARFWITTTSPWMQYPKAVFSKHLSSTCFTSLVVMSNVTFPTWFTSCSL